MMGKKQGVIINVSSVSSVLAVEGQGVYSATKGAVNSMTATLAKELATRGISVADVVAQLCSDSFAYVTGQVIVLDGGLSL